jgi:transcriptional regulator with PAS, ATPase and Fis domain
MKSINRNNNISCNNRNIIDIGSMKILMAWLGDADIAAAAKGSNLSGPIGQAVQQENYDKLTLLVDRPKDKMQMYVDWISANGGPKCEPIQVTLTSPTDFREIYQTASAEISRVLSSSGPKPDLTIHLTPGTPAMQAVWIILARTRTTARLIQSSWQQGVQEADIPFDIAAEFIPDLVSAADQRRREQSGEKAPEAASFGDILYRSNEMARIVRDAKKAALRNLPVLIEGESGTGKELFARAIHNNSPRKEKPFQVVNCGAIPSELVEAEFFGHKKGVFTGATEDREGAFDAADGGTIFLDEIGELPLPAQVTLLRTLQEGEVKRIGDKNAHKVDVRIIAATNRSLLREVAEGRFREDLYYRLAVATLDLPGLREREGDVGYLAEKLLEQVNESAEDEPGYTQKNFSNSAKILVIEHAWPGNVRELLNTIRRATLFADGDEITGEDMAHAIRPVPGREAGVDGILNQDISQGVDIEEKFEIVARHYLSRAMEKTGGNKTKAAKLMGLNSATSLTNWLEKYNVQ